MRTFAFKCILAVGAGAAVANGHREYLRMVSDGTGNSSSIPVNNATAFAINYGYPLALYASSLDSVISTLGVNAIFHENNTASAGEAAIVRPNVDTLYSKVAVDLSHANVAITVPPVPNGRYYVFPFYDLWGNNFANIGKLQNTTPGTYLIRPAECSDRVGFELAEDDSEYLGFINFPTAYGIVLPRILLLENSTADLDAVHHIQSQIEIKEIPRPGPSCIPPLTVQLLGNRLLEPMAAISPAGLNETSIRQLLEVTAVVAPYNPPIDPEDGPAVLANFAAAGLSHSRYSPPAGVNYTAANLILARELLESLQLQEFFGNEWQDFLPQFSGNFHDQYGIRSIIAYTGYLQLVQEVVIYPQWVHDREGFSLGATQSYILTFPSGKPPVDGFWSITAYNSSSYLIPNSLDVYSLGDRSNITYADGELVYGLNDSRNDAFSILIQPADVAPPSNWTSNWLPAPAGGGNFTANLRFYGPTEPLFVGGSYVYPVVTKQDAITE